MTTEELESKLEGGVETQSLEIKGHCDWNVQTLAKDILAMSNVQDGGFIVIGVEDNTFTRQGITATERGTYNIDIMKDQMAPFADPHVNFKVDFVSDSQGKDYVVITVFPFEEIPVICRKDSRDTRVGVIYYRNKNGRVQSGAVSSSYDMRDIITTATIKMMQRRMESGFTAQPKVGKEEKLKEKLNKELGDL